MRTKNEILLNFATRFINQMTILYSDGRRLVGTKYFILIIENFKDKGDPFTTGCSTVKWKMGHTVKY